VGVLRLQHAHQGPGERVKEADHGSSSGNTWRPSAPSGSGLTQRT
jgi:hypothetical protein